MIPNLDTKNKVSNNVKLPCRMETMVVTLFNLSADKKIKDTLSIMIKAINSI